jgi:hypothetical protein
MLHDCTEQCRLQIEPLPEFGYNGKYAIRRRENRRSEPQLAAPFPDSPFSLSFGVTNISITSSGYFSNGLTRTGKQEYSCSTNAEI